MTLETPSMEKITRYNAIPEVTGPSAIGDDFRRFTYLTATLAITEFKLRFFGSFLGYLWQLLRPLLLFGVLYLVFTEFVKIGGRVDFYPVVLLTNIVLFTFFSEATSGSVASVLDRENLVRKIHFPRLAIPVSVVVRAAMNLSLNLIVVLIFALASGVTPTIRWLEIIPLIAILGLLAIPSKSASGADSDSRQTLLYKATTRVAIRPFA